VIDKKQVKKSETAVQLIETPALGRRRAEKSYTWPIVLPANLTTVWAAALAEGVSGNWVLEYRQKTIGPGYYSIQSKIVECKEVTICEHTAGYTDDSVTTVKEVQDSATLPNATDAVGTIETVKGGMNLYGKYDYVRTTTTARVPKSCPAAITWTNPGSYYTTNRYTFSTNVKKYWLHYVYTWQIIRVHTLSFHLTAAEAAAACTGGESGYPGKSGDLWMAHKTVRADINTSVTTLDNPYE